MSDSKQKKSHVDKEKALIEKLEKAKKDLAKLQNKRKMEIGQIAMKAGLSTIDDKTLAKAFSKLAKELGHGNQ